MQQVEDLERIFCETKIFRKNKNQQQTNEQKKKKNTKKTYTNFQEQEV